MTKFKRSKTATSIEKSGNSEPIIYSKEPVWIGPIISTGSTLLDLAISGLKTSNGGIPLGYLVEIYGPSTAGKTALLSEIAGSAQRQGGDALFGDPESRLDKEHMKLFGCKLTDDNYRLPQTIVELFEGVRDWNYEGDFGVICADSLAALSTDMEIEGQDKYGMRRAKDFSEQLRKTVIHLHKNNKLLVASNQIRDAVGVTYGEKQTATGGKAIGFYSAVRIKLHKGEKVKKEITVGKKKLKRTIGIKTKFEVIKNNFDRPYREGFFYIFFDYGVDDISANLQWLKETTGSTTYFGKGKSLDEAAKYIEENNLQRKLKREVKKTWLEIESKISSARKKKYD